MESGTGNSVPRQLGVKTRRQSRFRVGVAVFCGVLGAQAMFPATAFGQGPVLEQIVVTATKRPESIQDVPLSITAFGQDRIEKAGLSSLEEIQYYVPSMTLGNIIGFANVFVRGLGDSSTIANIDPAVSLHVDGAVVASRSAQLFSFFDLERIEVLRGPQGTLYGRNSTGGAINLITARPTEETEGYVRVGAGNYSLVETQGALSGPVSERVQGRVAWSTTSRGGFGKNVVTNNDVDDLDTRSVRASLAFQPTDSLDLSLITEYTKQDDASLASKFKRETFPGHPVLVASGIGGFAEDPRDYASEFDPANDRQTWYVTAIADWQMNEALSIKNTLNYREADTYGFSDLDVSAVVNRVDTTGRPTDNLTFVVDNRQFSEELQLTYDGELFGRPVRTIAGLFYFTDDVSNVTELGLTATVGLNGGPKRVSVPSEGETDAWAVYWNTLFNVTDQVAFKLGGRFSHEERSVFNRIFVRLGGGIGPQVEFPSQIDDRSFDDFTPEVGLEWRPRDGLFLYYTYSEGFKAGTGPLGSAVSRISDPETIENHEVGIKSSWLGNRLHLNVAAFSYTAEDLQINRNIPGGPTGVQTVFENVAGQDAIGVEVELSWAVTDRLLIGGSGSWIDAELDPFLSLDDTNPGIFRLNLASPLYDPTATFEEVATQVGGNNPISTPELQWTLHGEYAMPLPNGGTFTVLADVSYKDKQYFDIFNADVLSQDDYSVIDARLRYASPDELWTVDIWGKNLSDKQIEAVSAPTAGSLTIIRTFLPPLTWGVTVGYRF